MSIQESLGQTLIDLQSYLLIRAGIKSVFRIALRAGGRISDEAAKKLGVVFEIKKFDALYGSVFEQPIEILYVALSSKPIEAAYEAEVKGDRLALGKLLGYPECCIKGFIESLSVETEFISSGLKKTQKTPSFFCNGIFNIESKWFGGSDSFKQDEQAFSNFNRLFLIKHIPHSLDCPESINLGRKTLELLEKESPEFAKEIVDALKRPFLYFNYFDWLAFKGKVRGQELIYEEVIGNLSYSSDDKIKQIVQGNRLIVSDKKIIIYKDQKVIGELIKKNEDDGLLIDFK